jgi:ribosomal protein S3
MGHQANLNTIRIGHTHPWKSEWFGDVNYKQLISQEYRIREYISNIFFNFKLPVSDFTIKRYHTQLITIDLDLYFPADIKEKFYVFQNKEAEIYDCIDSILYFLKNELYSVNINITQNLKTTISAHTQLRKLYTHFLLYFNRNYKMFNIKYLIYYGIFMYNILYKQLNIYSTRKLINPFFSIVSKFITSIYLSKTTQYLEYNIQQAQAHGSIIHTNNKKLILIIFSLKVIVFISLYTKYSKYISTISLSRAMPLLYYFINILKIIYNLYLRQTSTFLIQHLIKNVNRLSSSYIERFYDYENIYTDIKANFLMRSINNIYKSGIGLFLQKHNIIPKVNSLICYLLTNISKVELYTIIPYLSNNTNILLYFLNRVNNLLITIIKIGVVSNIYIPLLKLITVLQKYTKNLENINNCILPNAPQYNNTMTVLSIDTWQHVLSILNIKWSIHKFENIDDYFFRNIVFKQINYSIEHALSLFLQTNCIVLPNMYIKDNVPLNNPKMIAQYVSYEIEKGSPVSEIYRDLKSIYSSDLYKRNDFFKRIHKFKVIELFTPMLFNILKHKVSILTPLSVNHLERVSITNLSISKLFNYINTSRKNNRTLLINRYKHYISEKLLLIALYQQYKHHIGATFFKIRSILKLQNIYNTIYLYMQEELNYFKERAPVLYLKKYPIEGIRISASGTFKRGTEAVVKWYIEGKMPKQTVDMDVEQYVNHAFTRNGVIGIKVSFFFNSNRFKDEIELKSEEFLDHFHINLSKHTVTTNKEKNLKKVDIFNDPTVQYKSAKKITKPKVFKYYPKRYNQKQSNKKKYNNTNYTTYKQNNYKRYNANFAKKKSINKNNVK